MTTLRFFIVGGVILIFTGVLQAVVRPRKRSESPLLNRGTIWAVFCIAVGVTAILVGAGVIPISGVSPPGG